MIPILLLHLRVRAADRVFTAPTHRPVRSPEMKIHSSDSADSSVPTHSLVDRPSAEHPLSLATYLTGPLRFPQEIGARPASGVDGSTGACGRVGCPQPECNPVPVARSPVTKKNRRSSVWWRLAVSSSGSTWVSRVLP